MLCRHSQLVGPCEQPEINAFLDDHYPTSNDSSFGRFYVVKRDEDIPTPAAEGWKGRNKAFVAEMAPFMEEMTDACETIAEHAPVRGNKSKGTRSQKDLRETEHAKFKYRLREIAAKHGVKSGAWLAYLSAEEVDNAWERTVEEIAHEDGRLSQAGATMAKVSTSESEQVPPYTLMIWVENSYDATLVETVFLVCVEHCGFAPTAFKDDGMSVLGITAKHKSKISPSIYGKTTFMSTAEASEAVENYKRRGPAAFISPLQGPPPEADIDWDLKFLPPLDDDDSDDEPSPSSAKGKGKGKARAKASPRKKAKKESSEEEDEGADTASSDDEKPYLATPSLPPRGRRVTRAAAQKALKTVTTQVKDENADSDEEDEEEEKPLKNKGKKRAHSDDDEGAWTPGQDD